MKRLSSMFTSNTEKKEEAKVTTLAKSKKPVNTQTTLNKLGNLKSTHPIHVTVFDGYQRYSYLMASAAGAQDVFFPVSDNTSDAQESYVDDDDDMNSSGIAKNSGEFAVPVNASSGRNTMKAFNKSVERGGRGGLRTIVHELSGAANGVVIRHDETKNGYFYGTLDIAMRVSNCVPILVVCAHSEEELRAIVKQELKQPDQFKYVYGDELKKMDAKEREKYDKGSKEYNEKNQIYWQQKSEIDYWKPLIAKIDAWNKQSEKVQIRFVTNTHLDEGKNFFERALADSTSQATQPSPTVKSTIESMLLSA